MALPRVAAFTDSYHPTVNGVTYTVATWRDRWLDRGGAMPIAYPRSAHDPASEEYPVRSLPFPFYEGYRFGFPSVPNGLGDVELDLVHAHTPFGLGVAGWRLARKRDLPLVASYHTPTSEYAGYVSPGRLLEGGVRKTARTWERIFFGHADLVVAPTARAARRVTEDIGADVTTAVVTNGVDTEFFRPVDTAAFRDRHDLPDGPLVGYTGRHGHEKCLTDLIDAVDGLDVTLVFGGDGPARGDLEAHAADADVDAHFLGFLDRAELPELYATLDVFGFPSPVETQGLVALEANACGTPVVGVDSGALGDTVRPDETGYLYEQGDVADFRARIEQALANGDRLAERCLERRDETSVEHSVDRLVEVYEDVLGD